MKFGDLGWIGSLKLYYLGEWAVKDQAYRYSNRPRKGNDEQTVNTEGSTK